MNPRAASTEANQTGDQAPRTNDQFKNLHDNCQFAPFKDKPCEIINLTAKNLENCYKRNLGAGAYGTVDHYVVETNKNSQFNIAIKKIKIVTGNSKAQHTNELTLRDMKVAQHSRNCDYTVGYFETMAYQGEILIVMELMDTSLDNFYPAAHFIKHEYNNAVPEDFIKMLAYCLVEALQFLKQIQVIHRDVKPSNILIARKQNIVKLCEK